MAKTQQEVCRCKVGQWFATYILNRFFERTNDKRSRDQVCQWITSRWINHASGEALPSCFLDSHSPIELVCHQHSMNTDWLGLYLESAPCTDCGCLSKLHSSRYGSRKDIRISYLPFCVKLLYVRNRYWNDLSIDGNIKNRMSIRPDDNVAFVPEIHTISWYI